MIRFRLRALALGLVCLIPALVGCDRNDAAAAQAAPAAPARPAGHVAGSVVEGLPAPQKGAAQLDGLYMVVRFSGSSIRQFYYFFTPAGYVHAAVPAGGPEQFDFADAANEKPDVTGVYRIDADKLTMTFANGKSREIKYGVNKDKGYVELEGLYAHKAQPFKPGTTFDGAYTGSATAGGGGAFAASARTFTFTPAGTFTLTSVVSVSARSAKADAGASSQSSTSGTYAVSGNTLVLKHADGKETRHTIFPYENYDRKIELNIDGGMHKPK